ENSARCARSCRASYRKRRQVHPMSTVWARERLPALTSPLVTVKRLSAAPHRRRRQGRDEVTPGTHQPTAHAADERPPYPPKRSRRHDRKIFTVLAQTSRYRGTTVARTSRERMTFTA